MQSVLRQAEVNRNGKIIIKAYDIDIIGRNKWDVTAVFRIIES